MPCKPSPFVMSEQLKSFLAGLAATPFILLMTLGIGLASGLDPHFLLVSVLATNILGILFDPKSADFFNIGPGLVVLMFAFQSDVGLESGHLPTFIMFAIPAIVFAILSWLPINYLLVPNRVIAILAFGIGMVIIIKQFPFAFAYNAYQGDFSTAGEEQSFLATSTVNNWLQLALALSIPVVALIGHRFKKGQIALVLATIVAFALGYLLGYGTTPLRIDILTFNKPFQIDWTISPGILAESIWHGLSVTAMMLISFWGDFSTLNHDQLENRGSIKKSLRTVGLGNLVSGLFGVMPANISLTDSFTIRAFGGIAWLSKLPLILIMLLIAVFGFPTFNVPISVFAGFMIYIGLLLLLKSWELLKHLHWVDYIFTFLIGGAIMIGSYAIGFVLAMIYTFVFSLLKNQKSNDKFSDVLDQEI